MNERELKALLSTLARTPAMQSKLNIAKGLAQIEYTEIRQFADLYGLPGDDTAALKRGFSYSLHACEGMIPSFVEHYPYFAGWSAVMANVSDIAAMGGRATSVVNSFWHNSAENAQKLMQGMQDACSTYGVPLVGGHTHIDEKFQPALSVAIQGEATKLLSVMHVEPKQKILFAVNLKGKFHPGTSYWKCFESVQPSILRAQLEVLPRLAEQHLVHACRDISNAGILGSLLMLLEATGMGAHIDLKCLCKPAESDWLHWLQMFPSYGFLLTADEKNCAEVIAQFKKHDICCVEIGETNASAKVTIQYEAYKQKFWDFEIQDFTGLNYSSLITHFNQIVRKQDDKEPQKCLA